MRCSRGIIILASPLLLFRIGAAQSPVAKVVQLLTDLEAKVIKEGEDSQKTYAAFSEWCEDRSRNLVHEITTGKSDVEELKASIEKAAGTIASLDASVEESTSNIAADEADLQAATAIRETEEKDFATAEKELVEVVDALERAIGILEREARKGAPAMIQLQRAPDVLKAVQVMVDASLLGSQDAARLTALVQSAQDDGDEDIGGGFVEPKAAAYESHSASVIETLEGLLDKAKEQLENARTKEVNAKHAFQMLKQSLEDEVKYAKADLDNAKKGLAIQADAKASAEGDLAATTKELNADMETQRTLKQDCFTKSKDYEAEVQSRDEELQALAQAKKIISEQAGGAADITYSAASLLQLDQAGQSMMTTSADLANYEAVRLVRRLAEEQHSEELMQLARRMASAIRYGSNAGDPFAKVKDMIRQMLQNLEKDAEADASHKAYCDKEMGETAEKKADKQAEMDKLSTSIDSMTTSIKQLKEEVAAVQANLAKLARAQSELDTIRREEKAEYAKNKPEMLAGLEAVKMAMKLLREYYAKEGKAHEAAEGASSSIIGLLEVVESDFSRLIAEMSAAESSAQAAYDTETRANEIEKATSEQAVKYKSKSSVQLEARTSEAKSDRDGVQAELSAILEYKARLLQMCVAKPQTYSERKARRQAEIDGLKEALSILEGEAVLLQRKGIARHLRGKDTVLSPSA
mmetsp:Transcript_119754/g.344129  ORF Transcript_119754/g.344129 Transcript_119754/m.344129 type:complete len:696 (-) Transcript_119754:123-2210(-)